MLRTIVAATVLLCISQAASTQELTAEQRNACTGWRLEVAEASNQGATARCTRQCAHAAENEVAGAAARQAPQHGREQRVIRPIGHRKRRPFRKFSKVL